MKVREALNWMFEHPKQRLYDDYANYFLYDQKENIIEHHYIIDNEESIWDMDRYSKEDFIKQFDNVEFEL